MVEEPKYERYAIKGVFAEDGSPLMVTKFQLPFCDECMALAKEHETDLFFELDLFTQIHEKCLQKYVDMKKRIEELVMKREILHEQK